MEQPRDSKKWLLPVVVVVGVATAVWVILLIYLSNCGGFHNHCGGKSRGGGGLHGVDLCNIQRECKHSTCWCCPASGNWNCWDQKEACYEECKSAHVKN